MLKIAAYHSPATLTEAVELLAEDGVLALHNPGYTMIFNLTGFPALALPCGFHSESNLPIGFQLAARPWRELLLFRVADAYERAASWPRRRPAIAD